MYTHYRGTPFQFAGAVYNNGAPMDLTGATVTATVFDPTGTTAYGQLTCTVSNPANLGVVTLAYGNTSNWPVGKARLDMLIYLPNNNGQPLASDPCQFRIAQTPML